MMLVNSGNLLVWIMIVLLLVLIVFQVGKVLLAVKKLQGNEKLLQRIRNFKQYLSPTKKAFIYSGLLILLAVVVVIILLRPSAGIDKTQSFSTNLDIIFLVDISPSMGVSDFGDKMRIEKVAEVFGDFLEQRNDRYGLISFADEAMVEMPLTFDKQTVVTGFDTFYLVAPQDTKGTLFTPALEEAKLRFVDNKKDPTEIRNRVIVLVSDGEQVGEGGDYAQVVKQLRSEGISVYTVGVGTEKGGYIPYSPQSDFVSELYVQEGVDKVVSKLESEQLKEIAEIGGGKYFEISGENANLDGLSNLLDQETTNLAANGDAVAHKDLYYYFAIFALIIFIIIDLYLYSPFKVLLQKKASILTKYGFG